MNKAILATTLALTAAAFAVSANAQDVKTQSYFKVGATNIKYNAGGTKVSPSFDALNVGLGYNFSKHFSAEIDSNIGFSEKSYNIGGYSVKTKLDYDFGAYLVGKLPVTSNLELIGRVGYLHSQVKVSALGNSGATNGRGAAIGAGLVYYPKGGKNGVRVDATHFDLGEDKGDMVQVDFIRRF